MHPLAEAMLSNVVIATLLAAIAAGVGCFVRRPPVIYALWLLVLLKLVTPPLVRIPVGFLPHRPIERSTAGTNGSHRSGPVSIAESTKTIGGERVIGSTMLMDDAQHTQRDGKLHATHSTSLDTSSVEPFIRPDIAARSHLDRLHNRAKSNPEVVFLSSPTSATP